MSQYPSGIDLEQGQRSEAIQRPRERRLIVPEPRETLDTPGLAVLPPTPGRNTQSLLDALDRLGGIATTVAVNTSEDRIRASRAAAAERDEATRKAADAERGQASLDAATLIAKLGPEIESGKLAFPDDPDGYVEDFITARTNGRSAEYAAAFRQRLQPAMVGAFAQRGETLRTQAASEDIGDRAWAAMGVTSEEHLRSILDGAAEVHPGEPRRKLAGLIAVPALRSAADNGNLAAFDAATRVLAEYPEYVDEIAAARKSLFATATARAKAAEDGAADALERQIASGQPLAVLLDQIKTDEASGLLRPGRANDLRAELTTRAQQATETNLRGRILRGEIDAASARAEVMEGTKRPKTAPDYIDPEIGASILNSIDAKVKFDRATDQVQRALAGGPVVLNQATHGAAMDERIGPDGLGLITADGTIGNARALGGAMLQTRLVPPKAADAVLANLAAGDVGAAEVVGMLGLGSDVMFEQVRDRADARGRMAMDAARDAAERGLFASDAGRIKAQGMIAAARNAPLPPAKTPADVLRTFKDTARIDLGRELTGALDAMRNKPRYGYTKDTLLGFDFADPDAVIDPAGQSVASRFQSWFVDRWSELPEGMSPDKRRESAARYAAAKLEDSTDLVRWGQRVYPVLIDSGAGRRLPDSLRWADGFEAEATADLRKLGFEPDDVDALVPYPGASDADAGWTFTNAAGVPLVNDRGEMVVWRPTDAAAKEAERRKAILDAAEIRSKGFTLKEKVRIFIGWGFGPPEGEQ